MIKIISTRQVVETSLSHNQQQSFTRLHQPRRSTIDYSIAGNEVKQTRTKSPGLAGLVQRRVNGNSFIRLWPSGNSDRGNMPQAAGLHWQRVSTSGMREMRNRTCHYKLELALKWLYLFNTVNTAYSHLYKTTKIEPYIFIRVFSGKTGWLGSWLYPFWNHWLWWFLRYDSGTQQQWWRN